MPLVRNAAKLALGKATAEQDTPLRNEGMADLLSGLFGFKRVH